MGPVPSAPGARLACSVAPTVLPASRTEFLGRVSAPAELELVASQTPSLGSRAASPETPVPARTVPAFLDRAFSGLEWVAKPQPLPVARRSAFGATASAPMASESRVSRMRRQAQQLECKEPA